MYVSCYNVIPVKVAGSLVSKRQNAGRRGHEVTLIDVLRRASQNVNDNQKISTGSSEPLWRQNWAETAPVMIRRVQLRPGAQLPPAALCLSWDDLSLGTRKGPVQCITQSVLSDADRGLWQGQRRCLLSGFAARKHVCTGDELFRRMSSLYVAASASLSDHPHGALDIPALGWEAGHQTRL